MKSSAVRPLTGLALIVVLGLIIALAAGLFRGDFTPTVPVTVISERAGLVMNPDAKIKLHGAQVGQVASIEPLPNGQAAIHLAMNPSALQLIPANIGVNIASSTVFGAKSVELVPPADPSSQSLRAGQVLDDRSHVTVEINTVFEQLVSVLSKIEPAKLNETLGHLPPGLTGAEKSLARRCRTWTQCWRRSIRAWTTSATTSQSHPRSSTHTPMRPPI